jgi:hypothetical protein
MYLYNLGTAVIIWLIVLGTINTGISNGSVGMILLGVIILISAIALEQIRTQKNKEKQKNNEGEPPQETKIDLKEQSSPIQNANIAKDQVIEESIIESTPPTKQKERRSSKIKEVFANIGWFFLVFFIIIILTAIFEILKSLFGL